MDDFQSLRLKATQTKDYSYEQSYEQLKKLKELKIWFGNPRIELISGKLIFGQKPSRYLVVINIPETYESCEFCQTIQFYNEHIQESHIFKTSIPEYFAQLFVFKEEEFAQQFYDNFNDQKFNQLEDYKCLIQFVQQIKIKKDEKVVHWDTHQKQLDPKKVFQQNLVERTSHCPICLENQNFYQLIILCGHGFHWKCLEQCVSNQCPLCRYQTTPQRSQYCDECQNTEDLWMCLICGHLGCSQAKHSHEHFKKSTHVYALEISTQYVYNHLEQQFVHRLLGNVNDGKLLEINPEGQKMDQDDLKSADTQNMEFKILLQQQQDIQRKYFEDKFQEIQQDYHNKLVKEQQELQDIEIEKEKQEKILQQYQDELQQTQMEFQHNKSSFEKALMLKLQLKKEGDALLKKNEGKTYKNVDQDIELLDLEHTELLQIVSSSFLVI